MGGERQGAVDEECWKPTPVHTKSPGLTERVREGRAGLRSLVSKNNLYAPRHHSCLSASVLLQRPSSYHQHPQPASSISTLKEPWARSPHQAVACALKTTVLCMRWAIKAGGKRRKTEAFFFFNLSPLVESSGRTGDWWVEAQLHFVVNTLEMQFCHEQNV